MIEDSFRIDGVTYVRLEMPCPVDEEFHGHNRHLWQHSGCGGDMYLGDNATFYCSKCKESIPCILAKFECPYHSNSGVGYFISKSVGAALFWCPPLLDETKNRETISFFRKLMSAYDDQIDEFLSCDKKDL